MKYAKDLVIGDNLVRCKPSSPLNIARYLPAEIIGRFVGLYIAEGCRDNRVIHISGHKKEDERRGFLRDLASKYDGTMQVQDREGNGQNINLSGRTLFGILDDYVAGSNAHMKHLTTKAWQRGNSFLEYVLRGYLEGDGHYDKKNDRWRLGFCNNDSWASDLRSICARLGVSLRLSRAVMPCGDKNFKSYRGQIRFSVQEKEYNSASFKKLSDNEIIKIGKPRARYYYDVEVEDEPHLFSLASGILTHNSAMPESCTDRPASALEYVFLLTKSAKYFFDMDAVRVKQTGTAHSKGKKLSPPIESAGIGHKDWHKYTPKTDMGGRNFRNTDLFFQSLKEPHGMIFAGDEPVGLDVNPQAFSKAHFATFPEKLIEPLILAGTSARGCCPDCGEPWVRVVEKTKTFESGSGKSGNPITGKQDLSASETNSTPDIRMGPVVKSKTIGWKPGCECGKEPIPCTVLDCFNGAGTSYLVSAKHNRRYKGIEISQDYADMTKERLELELSQPRLPGGF